MKKKLTLREIAPYLPYGLKAKLSQEGVFNLDSEYRNEYAYRICTITDFTTYSKDLGGSMKVDKTKDYRFDFDSLSEIEIILRPLSDITKEIEHNGEKFVPIIEMAKLYASTNDVEAIKGAVTNFHYFKCYYSKSDYQILIINDSLRGWFSYYFNDDEPNCGVNIVNEWEVRDKLFEWHFDVFNLRENDLCIYYNEL